MLNYADASITTVDGNFTVSDDPIDVVDGSEWPASNFTVKVWDGADPAILKAVILVGTRTSNALSDLTWDFAGHTDVNIADGDYIALNETRRDFDSWRYMAEPGMKPPDSPNGANIEFQGFPNGSDPVTDAGMTWLNQGTSTATIVNGHLVMTPQAATGYNVRGLHIAVPTAPYTVTTRTGIAGAFISHSGGGIFLRASGTGRMLLIYPHLSGNNCNIEVQRATNATTFSSAALAATYSNSAPSYFRVEDDATNINMYMSPTGLAGSFGRIHTETRANFLGTPDQVGLFVSQEHAGTTTKATHAFLRFDWTADLNPFA